MAYKKEDLIERAIKAAEENNLFFIEDVLAYLPCSEPTFYKYKINEDEELRQLLDDNKVKTKNELRAKWYLSKSPTLQLALYKLLASEEERQALSKSYTRYKKEETKKPEKPQSYEEFQLKKA